MNKFDFSLILPCYNEEEIFNDSVEKIIKVLDGTDYTWEIIFIDDKSKDKTTGLINKALKKYNRKNLSAYFHQINQGRGATVKEGFLKAEGKIIGFLDIDYNGPQNLDSMLRYKNYDQFKKKTYCPI